MLEEFKTDLRNAAMTEVAILDKYIFSGNPFIFCANTGLYAQLKAKITTHFGIGITAAHMVGSAKLGFSVAPDKLWKPFGEESDIDMVIISEDVFNILWEELSSINSLY